MPFIWLLVLAGVIGFVAYIFAYGKCQFTDTGSIISAILATMVAWGLGRHEFNLAPWQLVVCLALSLAGIWIGWYFELGETLLKRRRLRQLRHRTSHEVQRLPGSPPQLPPDLPPH